MYQLSSRGALWTDQGSGGRYDVTLWHINGNDDVGMAPGTFISHPGYVEVPPASDIWVLNLNRDRWCQ
jgi:hypothetical protein